MSAGEPRWGTVRDWMTREPESVAVDCSIATAVQRMHSRQIRHLLVVDGARLVGVLSNRDLRRLLSAYRLERLALLDMFPQSGHMEAVAQLVLA